MEAPATNVITPEMATSYAKVAISMPSVAGTRANGEEAADWGSYDAGSSDEATVDPEKISLVLYDEDNLVVGTGEYCNTIGEDKFAFSEGQANITSKGNVVFKLSMVEGAPLPTKVVAFVNTDEAPESFNLTDLTVAANKTGDYKNTDGNFIMTSAGYYNGEVYTIAADLDREAFYSTEAAASATTASLAADIYVERLAAKVTVQNASVVTQGDQKYVISDVNGKSVKFEFTASNWSTSGKAKDMYLLKKDFAYNASATWMNQANNYRSYWAEGTKWGLNYTDGYLANYTNPSASALEYISYNDLNTVVGATTPEYVLEHTYNYADMKEEARFNPAVAGTYVIIKGAYTITVGEESTPTTKYDNGFYLLYQGVVGEKAAYKIYTETELITYLCGDGIYDDGGNQVNPDNRGLSIEKSEGKFTLSYTGGTLYTDNQQENEFKKTTNAWHYVEKEGYFEVPIKHYTASNDGKNGYYGVVRNHSYVITITGIKGLAKPLDEDHTGDNSDEPIYPDPDDVDEAYIQATINVLSWHVIGQDVEL